jgi:uncharacterized protein (TIGR03083 family)
MSSQEIVDKMESVWQALGSFCEGLSEHEWKTPTDCPGWSVQDQLSHLSGSESRLLGRPAPDHTPADLSHVKNEIGARNEVVVDWRRTWSGAEVLAEFRELTGERLKILRAMGEDDFAAETQTPIGPGTVRTLLEIRVFDAWVHLQDMRRALQRPGNMEGSGAEHAVGRCAMAMPYVVGRKAQSPDGTTIVIEVTGSAGRRLAIGVQNKRANLLDTLPASPTVSLSMDVETFTCLSCGRWEAEPAIEAGKVLMDGDQRLGKRIVEQMNIMI